MNPQRKSDASVSDISPVRKHIDTFHTSHKQQAYEKGREDGITGTPHLHEPSLKFSIEFLVTAYESLYARCMDILKPTLQIQLGSQERHRQKEEDLKKRKQIVDLETEVTRYQNEIDGVPILSVLVSFSLSLLSSLLICMGETYLIAMSMQVLGKGMLFSSMIGLAVAIGLMLIATLIPEEIQKIQSILWRRLARVGLFLFIGSTMYLFGSLRSDYMYQLNGHQISPFLFALLNLIAFTGQYLLGKYYIAPLANHVRSALRAFRISLRIRSIQKQIETLKATSQIAEQDVHKGLEDRLHTITQATDIIPLINSLFKESVAIYKRANMSTRASGSEIPISFHQPIPDLPLSWNEPTSYHYTHSLGILGLLVGFGISGCIHTAPPKTETLHILIDVTDSLTISHTDVSQQIISNLAITTDVHAGEHIVIKPISHFKTNTHLLYTLPSIDMFEINDIERKMEIQKFNSSVASTLDSITSHISSQEASEVFFPLFSSLQELARSDADIRTLYVYSDLRHHTPFLDTYDKTVLEKLSITPSYLTKQLDSLYHIPSLHGISITFCYLPRTKTDDETFYLLSEKILTPYLTSHGATVTIAVRKILPYQKR